jgi:hypothetical protein
MIIFIIGLIFEIMLFGCDTGSNPPTKEVVATPTASPVAGAVSSGTKVTLATTTEGATIYYTIDESIPSATSIQYSSSIPVTAAITIKAIATKSGMNDSNVLTTQYTITSIDSAVEKTVEEFFSAQGITDLTPGYGGTFGNAHIDARNLVGLYLDSAETQPITPSTTITAGLKLYAKQNIWDEIMPGGNNVIATIYRGTYTVDLSSDENITTFVLNEYTCSGSGGGSEISGTNFRTRDGGDLMSGGSKVGTWAYIYLCRIKQGFIFQTTSGSTTTKIYMGSNATTASTVLTSYSVTIDLSDMDKNAWGIYAIK